MPLRVECSATRREADCPVRRELGGRITGTADMEDTKSRDKPKDSDRASPELRVVRVASNPGPDAQDRLRRLFSLLVKYATKDRQAAPEKDSPSDAPPAEDHAGEEG